jgi:hypothetical protein
MALIKCPDCAKEISDTAAKCLYCGSIRTPVNKGIIRIGKVLGSIGLIFYSFISLFFIIILSVLKSSAAGFFTFVLIIIWIIWIIVLRKKFL